LKIVTDKKILRIKSELVSKDENIDELVAKLKQANSETKNGCGVASVQIGIHKRIAWLEVDGQEIVLVNPEILKKSEKLIVEIESCLSIPVLKIPVRRFESIQVKINSFTGEVKIFSGFIARVIQHEIDHFNGILITDKRFKKKKKHK